MSSRLPDGEAGAQAANGDLDAGARADGASRFEDIDAEEAQRLMSAMVTVRLIDERMVTVQRQGRIGFYIGARGEEATVIGTASALQPGDWAFPSYRELGAALLRGMPLRTFIDNLFGNARDTVKGRQMPVHITDSARHFVSISSPVGTQIPQAVGAAWAGRMRGENTVAMAWFGDGTTSSADFHVGLNFAGVYKAPCVFVIRNNQWAISVPLSRQCAAATLAQKAEGYGIAGVRVDGNDLLAVRSVALEAVERARSGGGPTLIEAVSYRVEGHSTSDDPRVYRRDEEVDPWRRKDPIDRFRRYLEGRGLWDAAFEEGLRARVDAELREAVRDAEAQPPPALSSLIEDVYAEVPWNLREQLAELRAAGITEKSTGHH